MSERVGWKRLELSALSALARIGIRIDRRLILIPLLAGLLVALTSLLLPKTYQAEGTFLPDVDRTGMLASTLSGLATQLNLQGAGGGAQTPDFYGDLVGSRSVLDALAVSPLRYAAESTGITPIVWYGFEDETQAQALAYAREKLSDHLKVQVNRITGLVTIKFVARDPMFTSAVVNRIMQLVNDFNLSTYRSRARARREFTEGRLTEVATELTSTEERFADFNKRNRVITASPALQLEADRLRRAIQIREQVYLQITQQLEDARIEEVRDTPVITIVDAAVSPVEPSFPRPKLFGFLSAVLVGMMMLLTRILSHRHETDQPS